jgi:hypothetical protein
MTRARVALIGLHTALSSWRAALSDLHPLVILSHHGRRTNNRLAISVSPSYRAAETDRPERMGNSRHPFSRERQRPRAPHGTHGHADTRGMYRQACSVQIRLTTLVQIDEEVRAHAVKMALVHDLGEAVIGDITPHDSMSQGNLDFLLKDDILTSLKKISTSAKVWLCSISHVSQNL